MCFCLQPATLAAGKNSQWEVLVPMTFAPEFLEPEKVKAFQHRQRDTKWGYAFAHQIPFVGLWYAFDRRTITPFLYSLIGCVGITLVIGLVGMVQIQV